MRGFALGIALLLMVALVGQALTGAVGEMKSGTAAFLAGESYWSKAREGAVFHLYRYSVEHDTALLATARRLLDVQLGDRDARFALDREPPDIGAARAGFLRGMNPRSNVDVLIWVYRWFGAAPVVRDAMDVWRRTDPMLSRVVEMTFDLEDAARSGDTAALLRLRGELVGIDGRMHDLQMRFLEAILRADRWLGRMLLLFSAIGFTILAGGAAALMRAIVRRVRASEGGFRALFEQAAIGMARVGASGRVLAVNARLCEILGYPEAELLRIGFDRLDGSNGASGLRDLRERLFVSGDASLTEERDFRCRNGAVVRIKLTASVVQDHASGADRLLALLEDMSEAHRLSVELEHHASHDALTGLANRRELQRWLVRLLARSRRDDSRHALLLLDLDQFKLINDTCGHTAGDEYLCRIAARMAAELPDRRMLARIGGDEFAVVLESTPLAAAEAVAERLAAAIADTAFQWGALNFALTSSAGIVEISPEAIDTSWLLRAADTACYLAKDGGRNRIRVYVDSDEAVTRRRSEMEWVSEVGAALAEHRLFLFAQRLRDLRGQGGLRYELSARMMDRDGRLHAPGAFVPAAERYGQIVALDREIVRLALGILGANPAHQRELELCHVNVSAASMADPDFRDYLVDMIVASDVPGDKLCFELTETAAVSDLGEARAFIAAMHGLGCSIALDDFGSGMSSFGYLKSLPVDILKIDGLFVRNLADDPLDRAVLGAICTIGRTLGKYVIAEAVESEAVLRMLPALGADGAQGYAVDHPQPYENLLRATSGDGGAATRAVPFASA